MKHLSRNLSTSWGCLTLGSWCFVEFPFQDLAGIMGFQGLLGTARLLTCAGTCPGMCCIGITSQLSEQEVQQQHVDLILPCIEHVTADRISSLGSDTVSTSGSRNITHQVDARLLLLPVAFETDT